MITLCFRPTNSQLGIMPVMPPLCSDHHDSKQHHCVGCYPGWRTVQRHPLACLHRLAGCHRLVTPFGRVSVAWGQFWCAQVGLRPPYLVTGHVLTCVLCVDCRLLLADGCDGCDIMCTRCTLELGVTRGLAGLSCVAPPTVPGVATMVGIVALKAVNPHPMRVAPNPPGAGTRLVVQGVWAYVRHPMYCSILHLARALALALFHQAWPLFPMWGALLVCLTAKATYEERLLTAMFPKEYTQ
jgi:protein-S-isoprenylcysteine O-methyltransferase Ste14